MVFWATVGVVCWYSGVGVWGDVVGLNRVLMLNRGVNRLVNRSCSLLRGRSGGSKFFVGLRDRGRLVETNFGRLAIVCKTLVALLFFD